MPVSFKLSRLAINNNFIKFILIYSSFYVGNAIMSIFYIWRFRVGKWKGQLIGKDYEKGDGKRDIEN